MSKNSGFRRCASEIVLASALCLSVCAAQALPGTVARPAPGSEPLPPGAVAPGEAAELATAYAEMSCTQLADRLRWHETRAVPQQIAAWNAAVRTLPQVDPRARQGEYLRMIENASVLALKELLWVDALSATVDGAMFAAERIDKAVYLKWVRETNGEALDDLARRVTRSLGLSAGMPVTDWNSAEWKALVRRRAVEQAERMRLEEKYRTPVPTLALKRLVALMGTTQNILIVGNYFATVLGAWAPLLTANSVASSNEDFVAARAHELSAQMREGERMRLSYALRCGPDRVADASVVGTFGGQFKGMLGTIDFSPDGSYLFLSNFGQRIQGRFKMESGRIFLDHWGQQGVEQWFFLDGACLKEPLAGVEFFCRAQ